MAEQELDRNLAATPYKLEKAHERGQVARSADVVSAVVFTAAMVFLSWQGWQTWEAQFRLDQAVLLQAGRLVGSPEALWPLIETVLRSSLKLAGPLFATLMLAAVVGNLAQSAPLFSVEPLKPDWNRINPMAGLKRVFSVTTLFLGLRALLKLALLGAVVWSALKSLVPHFFRAAGLSASGITRTLFSDMASLGLKIAVALWIIALLDVLFTRRQFAQQMRMSHREMKDEVKHREGDPRIRARLRELRKELLKRAVALRNTRNADVLITNPTHVAVALQYVQDEMSAPKLLAKGSGMLAAAMRRIAARHGIPIVQNPPLARALFGETAVEATIPSRHYAATARILAWVFAMRPKHGARREHGQPAAWKGSVA